MLESIMTVRIQRQVAKWFCHNDMHLVISDFFKQNNHQSVAKIFSDLISAIYA